MAGGNVSPQLAPLFQQAGQQYGIPPAVLAGVASVETNLGGNVATSSAGAQGLMQFMPATARSLGVNPADARSAIFGAAKLLTQYGYHQNPFRAIGAYNGGPGNPQAGYARQVLAEAQRLAPQFHGGGGGLSMPGTTTTSSPAGSTFDQAGYRQAQARYLLGQLQSGQGKSVWDQGAPKGAVSDGGNPLLATGLLTTKAPDPANYYVAAQSNLQALAGDQVLTAHPAVVQSTGHVSNIAGGFLPQGAKYVVGRRDQGRDGQTAPGGPIVAPGDGYVVRIGSDPSGFGPRYPIVHFTTGPYAGRTMYIGHTLATVSHGSFKAGSVLSYTGTTGIGNATVPGWFEIGFADSGSPGAMGQPTPF